jgi:hypothetical protein
LINNSKFYKHTKGASNGTANIDLQSIHHSCSDIHGMGFGAADHGCASFPDGAAFRFLANAASKARRKRSSDRNNYAGAIQENPA